MVVDFCSNNSQDRDDSILRDSKFDKAQNHFKQHKQARLRYFSVFGSGRYSKPMGELHFIFKENKPEMFILLGTCGENLVLSHIISHNNLDKVMQMASTK